MGRFINCFTVVFLKLKKATILDLIWPISPQRVVIAKWFQSVCVCSVYAPYYVQANIESISSDTHQLHHLHAIGLPHFTIKIIILGALGIALRSFFSSLLHHAMPTWRFILQHGSSRVSCASTRGSHCLSDMRDLKVLLAERKVKTPCKANGVFINKC